MSRVRESLIVPESLSLIEVARHSDSVGLPERYLLPPDGHSIEAHIENLYPAYTSEKPVFDFACPEEGLFIELLCPHSFRQVFSDLLQGLAQSCAPDSIAAFEQLRELDDAVHMLRMAKHLLHKV